jgi:hypothetical protein
MKLKEMLTTGIQGQTTIKIKIKFKIMSRLTPESIFKEI